MEPASAPLRCNMMSCGAAVEWATVRSLVAVSTVTTQSGWESAATTVAAQTPKKMAGTSVCAGMTLAMTTADTTIAGRRTDTSATPTTRTSECLFRRVVPPGHLAETKTDQSTT